MADDLKRLEKQIRGLNQTIEKQKIIIDSHEIESSDLTCRLQDALEQLKQAKTAFRSEGKQQLERELQYEQLLEEREKEGNIVLDELRQEFEAKELRLSRSIQDLQNRLYLAQEQKYLEMEKSMDKHRPEPELLRATISSSQLDHSRARNTIEQLQSNTMHNHLDIEDNFSNEMIKPPS